MRLTELLKPENIKLGLASTNKTEAISELVQLLVNSHEIEDGAKTLQVVLEREALRATGIGSGLAIPHGKCPGLTHCSAALGRCNTPIEFGAIDGRPVTWIWLLVSPVDQTGPHIFALARISKLMLIDKFRRDLSTAETPQKIIELIQQQESAM